MVIFEPISTFNRLMIYNWQQKDWPNFTFDTSKFDDPLYEFAQFSGRLGGLFDGLSYEEQSESLMEIMITEAIKTSEIEGEYISRMDVVSSIKRNLGLENSNSIPSQKAEGAAQLMLEVRHGFSEPLSEEMLFSWHNKIMKGSSGVAVGQWRSHLEPMQIVSGPMGMERVHFEAPPSASLPQEMGRFIEWFNQTGPGGNLEIKSPPLRSAIAHLYFETIHPFEDGNGRIGRALSEKAISQGLGQPVLLSLSRSIEVQKKEYYAALQKGQKSNQITGWVCYFVAAVIRAQIETESLILFTITKAKFFDRFSLALNKRQLLVVQRIFREGSEGFEGGMSAKKYGAIAKTTKATATRDLQNLLEIKAFVRQGAGRSTRYYINFPELKT
ncbi:MAG: Fic family protein [Sphingobacteriales bacterium]|jgi:Fic family protein